MTKTIIIAWKDLKVAFRDLGALVLMLLTPFALTLAIAFAFGGLLGGDSSALKDIPVVISNRDSGEFGRGLVEAFQSADLEELLEPVLIEDAVAAKAAVDGDRAAAAVLVPEGFTESILPQALRAGDLSALAERQQATVEVYGNPGSPISSGVVRAVTEQILASFAAGVTGGELAITQLITSGRVSPLQAFSVGAEIGQRAAENSVAANLVALKAEVKGAGEDKGGGFDWLSYSAPSMAILFLMFTVAASGRTILQERDWGTLPRLLVTPSSTAQVLGGKVAGVFLVGLAQVSILIIASWLILGVDYDDPVAVAVVVLTLVAAATSWGILIAAYSRTPGQANTLGTVISLTFAALAGNFMPRQVLPEWIRQLSYVSPNAWGLEAFTTLIGGGGLPDVIGAIVALLVMAAVLFAVSLVAFRRQYA